MTTLTPKEKWMPKFLAQLERRPIVASACRVASISRETAYRYRENDPEFAALWESARQTGIDRLEEIAWQRAEEVSDTLMIFILKGNRPEVYRDTSRVDLNIGNLSDDDLIARTQALLAGSGGTGTEAPDPKPEPLPVS